MTETIDGKELINVLSGPTTRSRKRLLDQARGQGTKLAKARRVLQQKGTNPACDLRLYVRWTYANGKSKVIRLVLEPIASINDLQGLSRRLIHGAFSSDLPDYLVSPGFHKYTPTEDFVSLPGDVTRTEFRLVATIDGWECTIAEREMGGASDPEKNFLITAAEFETEAVQVGDAQVALSLVSYPTVCVRGDFLEAALLRCEQAVASPVAVGVA